MNIRKPATMLAAALLLGTAILGTTADQAEAAKPRPKPKPIVYCYYEVASGEWELFLPGQTVYNAAANEIWTCGEDGTWKSRTTGPASGPQGPGGGVLAP